MAKYWDNIRKEFITEQLGKNIKKKGKNNDNGE